MKRNQGRPISILSNTLLKNLKQHQTNSIDEAMFLQVIDSVGGIPFLASSYAMSLRILLLQTAIRITINL